MDQKKHVKVTQDNKYPTLGLRRDPDALHHYVKEIRVLTPAEYRRLRAAISLDRHKACLLYTSDAADE